MLHCVQHDVLIGRSTMRARCFGSAQHDVLVSFSFFIPHSSFFILHSSLLIQRSVRWLGEAQGQLLAKLEGVEQLADAAGDVVVLVH
jgi:hypothetical protein